MKKRKTRGKVGPCILAPDCSF